MSGASQMLVAIIDDDDSLCRALARFLRAAGMQAVSYPSAEAFLVDRGRSRFNCLVIDVQLRGISGIELNQMLAASGSTTPVIFNTAHDRPDVRARAMRTGCSAYLRKSATGEAVIEAIHQATLGDARPVAGVPRDP
jgi:FixJ family two-component response regulator